MAAKKTYQQSKQNKRSQIKKPFRPDAKTRRKNLILLGILIVFIIMFYFVSIVKMKTVS